MKRLLLAHGRFGCSSGKNLAGRSPVVPAFCNDAIPHGRVPSSRKQHESKQRRARARQVARLQHGEGETTTESASESVVSGNENQDQSPPQRMISKRLCLILKNIRDVQVIEEKDAAGLPLKEDQKKKLGMMNAFLFAQKELNFLKVHIHDLE